MQIDDIKLNTELADVAKLFFGDEFPHISITSDGRKFSVAISGNEYNFDYSNSVYDIIPVEHREGRLSKIAVYDALSGFTRRDMAWGALTGVRPTKLFYECLRAGKTANKARNIMTEVYRVSEKRAEVLNNIVAAQNGKCEFDGNYYNLYVHVPYCTTRCTYCSFVSAPIGKFCNQSREYVKLLCDEIHKSVDLLLSHNKRILSIYIGGGTPTALDDVSFDMLLSAIGDFGCEYTCEAGRPDTVTKDKVDIMKAHGVTRVCVNPQTLNQNTLEAIGRSHSVEDFFKAYETVQARGFDINCDLIAGLEGETEVDFVKSYNGVRKLCPHNITVHSLSKKNGSAIRYSDVENHSVAEMIEYALNNLGEYRPYYLYRQKRQAGNLENVGLSLVGKECVNNITTMEETVSVMACGAGAISKIVRGGEISRFANMRDVSLYINRYDEKLKAKLDYFCSVL